MIQLQSARYIDDVPLEKYRALFTNHGWTESGSGQGWSITKGDCIHFTELPLSLNGIHDIAILATGLSSFASVHELTLADIFNELDKIK